MWRIVDSPRKYGTDQWIEAEDDDGKSDGTVVVWPDEYGITVSAGKPGCAYIQDAHIPWSAINQILEKEGFHVEATRGRR